MKPQVFIITKWPMATCVQAERPPSGGGPGSFLLDLVLILVTTRDAASFQLDLVVVWAISWSAFWGSFPPYGYASTSSFSVMDRTRAGELSFCSWSWWEEELVEWMERADMPSSCFSTSTTGDSRFDGESAMIEFLAVEGYQWFKSGKAVRF